MVVNSAEVAKEVNLNPCFFTIYNAVTNLFLSCNYTIFFIHLGQGGGGVVAVWEDLFSDVSISNPKFLRFIF